MAESGALAKQRRCEWQGLLAEKMCGRIEEIGGVRFLRAPEFFWPLINKSDGSDSELGRIMAEKVKGQSRQLDRILFGGVSAEDWVTMGVGHMQGQLRACEQCGVTAVKDAAVNKACGKCKYVYYCSRECQVKHWPKHKAECRGYQLKKDEDAEKQRSGAAADDAQASPSGPGADPSEDPVTIIAMEPHALLAVACSHPRMSAAEAERATPARMELHKGQVIMLKSDTFHALGMPPKAGGTGTRMYMSGGKKVVLYGYQL